MPIEGWNELNKVLVEALDNYNELNAAMNLVLFEDAMMHICRINRILESPRGNALLIGVGGSGKQSLSRLASFISSLDVFQIQLRKGYSAADLKAELAQLYLKAGLKNMGLVFLMSDAQVADERFLVLINDLLASGEIPDLFADDEFENIINGVRNEVKGLGMEDSRDNCWSFFIDKVRRTLKVKCKNNTWSNNTFFHELEEEGFWKHCRKKRWPFNPFPNKPLFFHVCSTGLSKTLWEKEKLLVTSNFSFFHSVFYPFG